MRMHNFEDEWGLLRLGHNACSLQRSFPNETTRRCVEARLDGFGNSDHKKDAVGGQFLPRKLASSGERHGTGALAGAVAASTLLQRSILSATALNKHQRLQYESVISLRPRSTGLQRHRWRWPLGG